MVDESVRSIHVLIADDHELVREAIKGTFRGTEIAVVAEAMTCPAAIWLALEQELDVVLLDITMPGGDGFDVLAHIKSAKRDLPVLIYSVLNSTRCLRRGRALGASGWLAKGVCKTRLLEAVRLAAQGESMWGTDDEEAMV
jgi:DNA-binding NarL/FixJ family response regulator